jgi:hypothetical protein
MEDLGTVPYVIFSTGIVAHEKKAKEKRQIHNMHFMQEKNDLIKCLPFLTYNG